MNLRQMCLKSHRLKEVNYRDFLREIGAIEIHGLEEYFMFLLKNNIKVSNTCNSIVAYLIGITDEKPAGKLNYKGGTVPDIDIDNMQERRNDGKTYFKIKYGADSVASIGTYNFLHAKGAIRAAARALGLTQQEADYLANLIPKPIHGISWTLDQALETVEELNNIYNTNHIYRQVIDIAKKLENIISSRSKHAAGIIVAPFSLYTYVPIRYDNSEDTVIEFNMSETESLGLLKIDLLGLKTLDIIVETIKLIKENHGIEIDPYNIPLNDKKAFDLLASGKLMGIFQLEGEGISEITKAFKPRSVLDVAMISALYRPGPLQFIPSILAIKEGKTPEIPSHSDRFPVLKDILQETYGFFVYQEQIQKVAEIIGGFTDSEADDFRRAIAKKKKESMQKMLAKFYNNAIKKGLKSEDVNNLIDEMESFSSYCFNKSHAVSYAIISVQLAYLKAHFPKEFYVANLNFELGDQDKIRQFLEEARYFNINILPPDINKSHMYFTVDSSNGIRFGLAGITGIGETVAKPIIEERNNNGQFKSITDFIIRTKPKINVFINLIKAGAFDNFACRAQLLYQDETSKMFAERLHEVILELTGKNVKIDTTKELLKLPVIPEYAPPVLMNLERETTNFYLSHTPQQLYEPIARNIASKIKNAVIGVISSIVNFKSLKGCTIRLYGKTEKYLVFEDLFKQLRTKYSDLDALIGEYVVLSVRPFKEEGTFVVNSIEIVGEHYNHISYVPTIKAPINLSLFLELQDKAYFSLPVIKLELTSSAGATLKALIINNPKKVS